MVGKNISAPSAMSSLFVSLSINPILKININLYMIKVPITLQLFMMRTILSLGVLNLFIFCSSAIARSILAWFSLCGSMSMCSGLIKLPIIFIFCSKISFSFISLSLRSLDVYDEGIFGNTLKFYTDFL